MELTKQQLDGFIYAMELAADDQENYLDSGNAAIDYTADDMRSKAQALKDTAEAAYCIGQTDLGDRFENLSDTARMLADSMEPPISGTTSEARWDDAAQKVVQVYTCRGCGREESVCSADPCEGVKRDRES